MPGAQNARGGGGYVHDELVANVRHSDPSLLRAAALPDVDGILPSHAGEAHEPSSTKPEWVSHQSKKLVVFPVFHVDRQPDFSDSVSRGFRCSFPFVACRNVEL